MTKSKKIILTAALSSAILHLVIFLASFIPYYVLRSEINPEGIEIYEYIRSNLTRFLEFSIPAVACAVIYFSASSQSVGNAMLKALCIALGKLIYSIPEYYLMYMEMSGGASSVEAIILALLSSLLVLLMFWARIILLYALLRFIAKRVEYRKMIKSLTTQIKEKMTKDDKKDLLLSAKSKIDSYPEITEAFDFSNALCAGLFVPAFIQFIIYFVQEIAATVDYLTSYVGSYETGEILYMIFSFLFIFASMIVTHLINYKLASALREKEVEVE